MTSLPEAEEPTRWNSFRVKEERLMAVSQWCPDRPYLTLLVLPSINKSDVLILNSAAMIKVRSSEYTTPEKMSILGFSDVQKTRGGTYDGSCKRNLSE